MPSLGGSFPAEFKKNHFLNSVKPGCIVRVNIKFPEITKYKFLVILAEDDGDYLSFFINSEINQYIENKPALAKCQVLIKQEQHTFLKYDSYVACHELYPICQSDVLKDLLDGSVKWTPLSRQISV
jgi:hypothetical protein